MHQDLASIEPGLAPFVCIGKWGVTYGGLCKTVLPGEKVPIQKNGMLSLWGLSGNGEAGSWNDDTK